MINWGISKLELPLKFPWTISRGQSFLKENYIVEARSKEIFGKGEVAFNVRYGESKAQIEESFARFLDANPSGITTLEELANLVDELELPSSLRFGIESAFVHYLCSLTGNTIAELLSLNTVNSVVTSFSLPIMPIGEIASFINKYNLTRFKALKIKIDGNDSDKVIAEVMKNFGGKLRIDANEAFLDVDQVLKFERSLDRSRVEFIEQPLPASMHEAYIDLKELSSFSIMADESVTKEEIIEYYAHRFHAVNIKLMKSGGYIRALRQIRAAKRLGLKVMLGCMVESSLGIMSAMNVASGVDYFDLDGFLFLKSDPFNLVVEENGKLFVANLH